MEFHFDPLCTELYRRLQRVFGVVKVSNAGEALVVNYQRKLLSSSSGQHHRDYELDVHQAGEYYLVCCPFCGDQRFRLYINHSWAEFPSLAICFNANCLESDSNRMQLRFQVLLTVKPFAMAIKPGITEASEFYDSGWPGDVTPIVNLPADHVALRYLHDRRLEPGYLWDRFRVGFCNKVYDATTHGLLEGRIFIPMFMRERFVGWQGRLPYNTKRGEWPPKYFTMPHFPKRLMLYNFDSARNYRTVILQEGCTDVWATGPEAVAVLGKTLSMTHRLLLASSWATRGGSLVVCLDGNASLKAEHMDELRREFNGRIAVITYPEDKDPGSYTPGFNRRLIMTQAMQQGIPLPDFVPELLDV